MMHKIMGAESRLNGGIRQVKPAAGVGEDGSIGGILFHPCEKRGKVGEK